MSTEDENARAAGYVKRWQAHKAEVEAAAAEDAAVAQRERAVLDRERRNTHESGLVRNFVFLAVAVAAGLIFFEQQAISERAQKCLSGMALLHQYNCADQINRSAWAWLLSSETRALLQGSAGR